MELHSSLSFGEVRASSPRVRSQHSYFDPLTVDIFCELFSFGKGGNCTAQRANTEKPHLPSFYQLRGNGFDSQCLIRAAD